VVDESDPMNSPLWTIMIAALFMVPAWSQSPAGRAQDQSQQESAASPWSYFLNVTGYLVPNDVSYASPAFTADRKWLHLEGRYNYEDLKTGSLWAGYNLNCGEKVSLSVTPMLGAVFGNSNGIAPGYEFLLAYRKFELSSEGEYVYSPRDSHQSFFYSWDEFVYSPTGWFHAGLVTQHTRAYKSGLDEQRGFSVGVAHKETDFTVYTFNAGWADPTIALSLSRTF
jgi:hypothetical protein